MATTARKTAARKTATPRRSGARAKGKTIVILSDGTGNSASALFKTNIWRLYRALDISDPPPRGKPRQIAYYDDGIGTSSFRPLALLGGAFGIGLKRNVLDLYRFICRNYEDGDQIYAFGFSRGAFTVRVAVGLLASEGILKCDTEAELNRYSVDAYRKLRKEFKQGRWFPELPIGQDEKGADKQDDAPTSGVIVQLFRWVRDQFVSIVRRRSGQKTYAEIVPQCRHELKEIAFVGVFDTVAAYGMPIAELTRGVDNWIWPLSMPDYKLSEKVKAARHALALDDERDTFHPLVWDEHEEQRLVDKGAHPPGRMKQVWFSGMHADVGGGYPDDSSAHVPLLWMIREATQAGLRFDAAAVAAVEQEASPFAPLHSSRRGIGSYYRLQPRKLSARLDPPDSTSLIMQDPSLGNRGMLRSVVVHESVFDRIRQGSDKAAPIVLPAEYRVARYDGTTDEAPEKADDAKARAGMQEWIWNQVWKRRVAYFTTVGVSLFMAALPLLAKRHFGDDRCGGPLCFVSTAIDAVGAFLPKAFDRWIYFYAAHPFIFILFVLLLTALMVVSSTLQTRMRDDMRMLWMRSLGDKEDAAAAGGRILGDPTSHWIYRLRTDSRYQRALRCLKWKIVPAVFGFLLSLLILNLVVAVPLRTVAWEVCADDKSSILRIGAMCWLTR